MSRVDSPRGLIVVTGGSRGIGAAIARSFAQAGHPVLITFSTNQQAANAFVQDQQREGFCVHSIPSDLADEGGVLRIFEAADKLALPLAGLVNNAGVTGGFARLVDLNDDVLRRVLAVNVAGPFLCAREAVRRMSNSVWRPRRKYRQCLIHRGKARRSWRVDPLCCEQGRPRYAHCGFGAGSRE